MVIRQNIVLIKDWSKYADDENCLNKTISCSKLGAGIGLLCATHDAFTGKNPQPTFSAHIFRALSIGVIPVACFATFSTAICVSANLRGKDDRLNYIIGGASAGFMLGIIRRKILLGLLSGLGCATLGYIIKDSMIMDYSLTGQHTYDHSWMFDKTLYINKKKEN